MTCAPWCNGDTTGYHSHSPYPKVGRFALWGGGDIASEEAIIRLLLVSYNVCPYLSMKYANEWGYEASNAFKKSKTTHTPSPQETMNFMQNMKLFDLLPEEPNRHIFATRERFKYSYKLKVELRKL